MGSLPVPFRPFPTPAAPYIVMAQDWDIKPRAITCSSCEASFVDQQPCHSLLAFTDEGYVRADYCEPCWKEQEVQGSSYSTWKGLFKLPPPKPEEPLKKETAESLLRDLIEQKDNSKRNVIYILAVMLERKRLFVERAVNTRKDGTKVRMYEHRKTGETFMILDPELQLDQLQHVQEQVVTMLGGGKKIDDSGQKTEGSPSSDTEEYGEETEGGT